MSTREEVLARGGTYVNENGEPTEEPKPKEDDINDEARDVWTYSLFSFIRLSNLTNIIGDLGASPRPRRQH